MKKNTSNKKPVKVNSPYEAARLLRLQHMFTAMTVIAVLMAVLITVAGITKLARNISAKIEASRTTGTVVPIISTENSFTTVASLHTELLPDNPEADSMFGPLKELPEAEVKTPEHFEVRGLYVGSGGKIDSAIDLCKKSELNTIVLDLKNEYGIPYMSKNATARKIGYVWDNYVLKEMIDKCHSNGLRIIGRIVSFNDSTAAKKFPERAIRDADGEMVLFSSEGKRPFLSPYNRENWEYLIELAEEAASFGIDEIQYDYVRFPVGYKNDRTPYYGAEGTFPTKAEAINRFLQEARIRLQDKMGVPVSADIFGTVLTSAVDARIIGQEFETLGMTGIDSCCPMVYPSHYALGTRLGGKVFPYPDKEPYLIVYSVLYSCQDIYMQKGFTKVRPYIQSFTASYIGKGNYIHYGYPEINAQIKACKDLGINEFILWDPSVNYPAGKYDGNMLVETD
ncbi:MAG: putative glycoside hydrolase [Oscillospiraceae bacterium]|nr:putative glycoside hydrolase [Oscillospiraceae bacterium]